MLHYSNNNSKLRSLIISTVIFGGLIILGVHNFFIIENNSFRMLLNILGLIINSLMFFSSLTYFFKIKRKLSHK
ncbi:hypothetical protein [Clostridium tarantellae]|uniref:Uncharacterized protein n=1 Tax=Clostridium tarantellae TaxID=39493 RepID=A0A6I1MN73_9CLOT|nr:hypothetical protein [Clostridium tarantellae]MPQ44213.1 hypothetical protein [Clostridium tarantellae]